MGSVITDVRFGVNASQAIKVPCVVCSTSNITLSGEQTIDGVSVVTDDRVLVTGQTDASENGIYVADTGSWARSADWDGANDVITGTATYVYSGTNNAGYWEVTTTGSITIGTTSVVLSQHIPGNSNDANILGNKTAFANSALTGTSNFYDHDFHQSRPSYLDLDYDATLDGSDVTTEFQNAIDDIGTGGGWLVINGPIQTGAITFPTYTSWMRIDIYGTWTTTANIDVGGYMAIIGKGGAPGSQFHRGPCAKIVGSGTGFNTVSVTGTNKHYLSNLHIVGVSGQIALKFDGSAALAAYLIMDNVSCEANNSASSIAFQNDAGFWLWAYDCAFLAGASAAYSIDITSSATAVSTGPGLLTFKNTIVSGQGINWDTDQAVNPTGNSEFDGLDFENGESYLFTLDGTNSRIANVTFKRITENDSVSVPGWFNVTAPTLGDVRDIKLIECHPPHAKLINGDQILNLQIDTGTQGTATTGWGMGDNQYNWAGTLYGKQFGRSESTGQLFGPCTLPVTPMNFPADLSDAAWVNANITVTGSITGPDGSSNAYKLTTASGQQTLNESIASVSVAEGDMFVAFLWAKSETTDAIPNYLSVLNVNGGSWTWSETSGVNVYPEPEATAIINSGWVLQTIFGTVTGGSGTTTITLGLGTHDNRATSYFCPTVLQLPTADFSTQDAHRIRKFMTAMPPNVTSAGDVVSLLDHQKLRLGSGSAWHGASSIPTSGTYEQGDIVWNTAGSLDGNNMTLLGWYRLTNGSGHVSGTDWSLMYVSHVSPAT